MNVQYGRCSKIFNTTGQSRYNAAIGVRKFTHNIRRARTNEFRHEQLYLSVGGECSLSGVVLSL